MFKYIYGLFNKSMKIKLLFLFIIIIIGSMLSMYPIVLIRNIVDLAVSGATQNIKPIMRTVEFERRIYEYKTDEGKIVRKYLLDECLQMGVKQ